MIAAAWAPVQGWLALAGAALAAIGAAYLAGRRDGRDTRSAKAMREEQQTRRLGGAAALDAERTGAAERLQRGNF